TIGPPARERLSLTHIRVRLLERERREILPQYPRRTRVALDEHRPRSAARERLDAERARAREQVEHARSLHRSQQREGRLAHAIGCRTRRPPTRRRQPPAAEPSADHAHLAER